MTQTTDIIIHINETLDSKQRNALSDNISTISGIVSVKINDKRPHLLIVGYNSVQTKALEVVTNIRSSGLQAQLVSWL